MLKIFVLAALCVSVVVGQCATYTCLAPGSTCLINCGACLQNGLSCALGLNGTTQAGFCSCLDTLITCEANLDPSCRTTVKTTLVSYGGNCSSLASSHGYTCPTQCATIDAYPAPPAIPNTQFCNPAISYCSTNTSKCSAKLTAGAPCTNTDVCVATSPTDSTPYSCQMGTCQKTPGLGFANDPCTTTADCYSGITCAAGVCTAVPIGGACTFSGQCIEGSFCNGTGCQQWLASGVACTFSDSCGDSSVCTAEKVCALQYQKPVGAKCVNSLECTFGTFCNALNGNCTAYPTAACNVNTDCSNLYGPSSICYCSGAQKTCSVGYTNTAVYANCVTQATSFLTCLTTNACRISAGTTNTCAGTKCGTQYTAFATCIGLLAPNPYCPVPTSAGGSSASVNGGSGASTTATKADGSSVAICIMLLLAMIAALL